MKTRYPLFLAVLIALLASGCSIKREVTPVAMDTEIGKIHVQKNERVHMEGLFDAIIDQLRLMGYQAEGFEGTIPQDANFVLTYTANWNWDMAMYLTYFQANLLKDDNLIGTTTYDAKLGGWRFDKFGKTADKIRQPLEELLQNAKPAKYNDPAPLGTD